MTRNIDLALDQRWHVEEEPEPTDQPSKPAGEPEIAEADAVRSYLQRIGRVPLLNPREEVALCRRIETAQHAVAAALLAVPAAERHVAALALALRRGSGPDGLFESPEGRQLSRAEIDQALAALARARRRAAALRRLDGTGSATPRAGANREASDRRAVTRLLEAIERELHDVPLRAALIEALAAEAALGPDT